MSRVIIFSRVFPSYHPKAGQPTFFVEKFWTSIQKELNFIDDEPDGLEVEVGRYMNKEFIGKHHTIRSGNNWKVGDKFSPRVWGDDLNPKSGKRGPYQSKQIIIAPDGEVKKVWNFQLEVVPEYDNNVYGHINDSLIGTNQAIKISTNDGLLLDDFQDWFCKSPDFKKEQIFKGQIICWNENINY